MVKAVFAGSFDPPTNGHLDIIKRASGLFESVDVVVSVNPEKKTMFSEEERVEFLKELIIFNINIWVQNKITPQITVFYRKKR